MDDEICLPMPPIDLMIKSYEDQDEINVIIIQNTLYEMKDTIIQLEIENKNLKAVIDTKSQLINDLQNSMINSEDYVDDEQHKSYEAFLDYYKTNKDHIYRNLKNIMIKKGLYRTPRLAENIVNTHGIKLFNESIGNK